MAEVGTIAVFLVLAGGAVGWSIAQSAGEKRRKAQEEAARAESIRRKYAHSPT